MAEKTEEKRKKINLHLLGRITGMALPYKKLFVAAVVLTIIQSLFAAIQPYIYQHVIDKTIIKTDIAALQTWSLIILGILILQSAMGFANSYLSELIGQNVTLEMRQYVYRHLVRLRLSFFDKTPVGTAVTRTISDIETISDLFASGLITIAGDLVQIIAILFLMFWMNWKMALITLTVMPLLLYAANVFRKGVRDSFQEVRNEVARLNAFLQEHITGMQVVQIFNRQTEEGKKFEKINRSHRDANIRSVFYYAVFFPVVEVIVAIALALLIWWGTKGMLNNSVQLGEITAFIMFINLFFRPVRAIADRFNNIQMGMVAAERIFNLIDDKKNIESGGLILPENIKGKIEFKNVSFGYLPDFKVIDQLSFTLPEGKTLAVVGPTGSGKTTLINLLSRFYQHTDGEILIDDIPVEDYQLDKLRSKIAVVLQDVFLFSGTVASNITLKSNDIEYQNIKEAAEKIGAYDFIEKLPGGFEFNVMERGLSLSLGQRQLISFIRALAFNPSIIILDEATSSVDTETELLIQKAIRVLLNNRTAIVIAHRLSTIKHADYIMVLENGKRTEFGNHQTLLQQNGKYAELYNKQTDSVNLMVE